MFDVFYISFFLLKIIVVFIDLLFTEPSVLYHTILVLTLVFYTYFLRTISHRRVLYYKKLTNQDAITEHILQYRFKSIEDRNATFIFLLVSSIIFVIGIFYLRASNFYKEICLRFIVRRLLLYFKINPLLFLYAVFIIILTVYAFLLTLKIIRKFYLKHLMKTHFYYSSPNSSYYKSINNRAFDTYLYRVSSFLDNCYDKLISLICFFKIKNLLKKKNYEKLFQLMYFDWTKSEEEIFEKFIDKYHKYICFINKNIQPLVFHFHYLIFLLIIIFDLYYNDLHLTYTFNYLPVMFLINIYVVYCKFVLEKRPFGIIEFTHELYYCHVEYVKINNKEWMFVNGEPRSKDENYGEEFLKFELNGFKLQG